MREICRKWVDVLYSVGLNPGAVKERVKISKAGLHFCVFFLPLGPCWPVLLLPWLFGETAPIPSVHFYPAVLAPLTFPPYFTASEPSPHYEAE